MQSAGQVSIHNKAHTIKRYRAIEGVQILHQVSVHDKASGCAETVLPLPQWTILDASNITLKLKSQQATRNFFCDLAHMLSSVADAAADPGLPTLCRSH